MVSTWFLVEDVEIAAQAFLWSCSGQKPGAEIHPAM
jgi:hypothetical protein